MAKDRAKNTAYEKLRADIKSGNIARLYILHGEERYLLDSSVADIRRLLLPDGTAGFNYHRFEGSEASADELLTASSTLPFFAERTLIEVRDCDIFKSGEDNLAKLLELFSDLPEYVCLLFVYDTVEFKLDLRTTLARELKKLAEIVEFDRPEQEGLAKWVRKHFKEAGVAISASDSEYLAFMTGGLMSPTLGEIEKLISYVKNATVTRADIDELVSPALDAVAYKLTDAIAARDFDGAARLLDELLRMQEPPHKLMAGISREMRKLYAARLCYDDSRDSLYLKDMCDIKQEWQARNLLTRARRVSPEYCRRAVLLCCDTAYSLNSGGGSEALVSLLARLCAIGNAS
jgi:DNA polymerase-3 subunit delta